MLGLCLHCALLMSFDRVYVDMLNSDDDDFTLEDSAVQQAIEDSISPRLAFNCRYLHFMCIAEQFTITFTSCT